MTRMFKLPVSVMLSGVAIALFIAVTALAPVLAPYGVNEIVGISWDPPSLSSPLGTDMIGRDLLSRFI